MYALIKTPLRSTMYAPIIKTPLRSPMYAPLNYDTTEESNVCSA